MNVIRHMRKHQVFYAFLLVAALARLLFLFDWHEILWDSGVYFGMAKYIWSGGTAGLWEHIRPVLWPAVLGLGWQLKMDIVWFARVLTFLLTLVSTGLVYVLGRKLFSQRAAMIASVLWSFSAIMFYLSFHEYTEFLAAALVLGALVAFVYDRPFLAGLLAGLAFLAKFPAGMFIVVLGIGLLVQKDRKKCIPLGTGFVIPAGAFLLFNQLMYGGALAPLSAASDTISGVLGCNVLRYEPWWQYLAWIVFDNWFNVFAVIGVGASLKQWRRFVLPLLALILPAAYFMQLHCREYRYLLLFLPFVALFAGHGIALTVQWLEKRRIRHAWTAILLIIIVFSASYGIWFYLDNEPQAPDQNAEQYYRWLEGKSVQGEIWTSNPVVSVYTDAPVHKLYYPIYEEGTATGFNRYLAENAERISTVFLDNCGGGIICPSNDVGCEEQLRQLRSFLNENFVRVFSAQTGRCWYEVYTSEIHQSIR